MFGLCFTNTLIKRHMAVLCIITALIRPSLFSMSESTHKNDSIAHATINTNTQPEIFATPNTFTQDADSTNDQNNNQEDQAETDTNTRAKDKRFDNVSVSNYLDARNVRVEENIKVGGSLSVTGVLTSPGLNTENITIDTITKNGVTTSWPATGGAAGSFLANDGANNLVYATPAGGGNVSTTAFFSQDNKLITTDTPSSVTNIKQSGVTVNDTTISDISTLNATTVNATILNGTLNGNVGTKTTGAVVSATQIVENATDSLTPSTLVLRDASNNFSAGTITANITGNVSGSASTAGFATNATTAVNFSGSLSGNVSGPQNNTRVNNVGGSTDSAVNAATILANQSTDANTGGRIVRRTGAGNFSGGTITAETRFVGPLTGTVTGAVTGNVTGNLFGTADYATYATTSTNFAGLLEGDITGGQKTTYVTTIRGTNAATVLAGAARANAATENDTVDTLVKRDSFGNFATSMITLDGDVTTNPKNATTKEYVDEAVATGFIPKEPVLVVSLAQTATYGFYTLDGVTLSTNNRVLLIDQEDEIFNGIWLAQADDWTRPTDFANTTEPGRAYVLTLTGLEQAGSSWICSTPTALIGTDTVTFVQFSIQGRTTGNNVGTGPGTGQLFKDKVGILMNFKSLAPASNNFLTIANGTDQLTLAVTATSDNLMHTVVARDNLGDFYARNIHANIIGHASENVLRSGDTMTGDLMLANQKELRLQDAGSNYIGIKAPTTLAASGYTFSLPSNAPVPGQFLKALTSLTTTWTAVDGGPETTKTFFVEAGGNDTLNDGSLSAPFASIKKALQEANKVASTLNPVTISIGAGIFIEDNTTPLEIYSDGINIVGRSILGTVIEPLNPLHTVFTTTATNIEMSNFTIQSPAGSTQAAINVIADSPGKYCFSDLSITSFAKGFDISCITNNHPCIFLNNARFIDNNISVSNNNTIIAITNSYIKGSSSEMPGNTGITSTGLEASTNIFNTIICNCTTGIIATGEAQQSILSCEFEKTLNNIVCTDASITELTGCNFFRNPENAINVTASGAGTIITAQGCNFYCSELGSPRGTTFKVTNGGEIVANSNTIRNAALGIECGTVGDTETTIMKAGSVYLLDCTTDIQQTGTSMLRFLSGIFDAEKVAIENATNVSIASYDRPGQFGDITFSTGNTKDVSQKIYEVLRSRTNSFPNLSYEPNYYGAKGTVYKDPKNNDVFTGAQSLGNNTYSMVITSSRDKETGIRLISDMGSPLGKGNNIRGWAMTKRGNQADLVFTFTNNDSSGLAVRGPYNIMQLNGDLNQIEFPIATGISPTFTTAHLVWAGDTTLYRSADATLKIDNNLVVNNNLTANGVTASSLTASRAITTDANKNLTSSATTNSELGYLSGVTSAIQPQIASKIFRAGDTMTGTFTVIAGSATVPSLQFANGTNTGFSSQSPNKLSFDTLGIERMSIDSVGTVTINAFTTAGVVHNASSGALSSSLIVASDITDGIITGGTAGAGVKIAADTITNANINANAGIADTKLAVISTANKVLDSATTATSLNNFNTIVRRDDSGNFDASMITASLTGMVTGTASFNVLKTGDTMTGALQLPAGLASEPSLKFTGGTNTGLSSPTANKLSFDVNGVEKMTIDATTITATTTFISASACILAKEVCLGGIQVDATSNTSVTINPGISILLKTASVANYAVTMPANPINGQLITIMVSGNFNMGLTYPGSTVYYEVDTLRPQTNMDANSNGQSVTYVYYDGTWYRYSRG